MRSAFDFAPFRRSTVGFDRLFDMLENSNGGQAQENYPPFDLIKLGDNDYRIELAVAGFNMLAGIANTACALTALVAFAACVLGIAADRTDGVYLLALMGLLGSSIIMFSRVIVSMLRPHSEG